MDGPQSKQLYSWKEILPHMEEIRAEATNQFIAAWKSARSRHASDFMWHETMGYVIVKRDDAARRIVLSPRMPEILKEMGYAFDPGTFCSHPDIPDKQDSRSNSSGGTAMAPVDDAAKTCWRPAHARFALRCEPPYLRSFSLVRLTRELQPCLQARRSLLKSKLRPDEMLLSINQFPLLGAGTYIDGQNSPNGPLLGSQMLSDVCLNPIPSFTLEIDGINERRGAVPYTAVPVFRDTNTLWPFTDKHQSTDPFKGGVLVKCDSGSDRDSACSIDNQATTAAATSIAADIDASRLPWSAPYSESQPDMQMAPNLPRQPSDPPSNKNCLLLDSPLFGIGNGGVLRITLCAADLNEARLLHDQLAPISAIMAALTAATPIVKGYLVDRDCYWDVQCGTVDDRTLQERGIVPLTTAKGRLQKSRYGSIDMYLGPEDASMDLAFRSQYNDCTFTYDEESHQMMHNAVGIDERLSFHVSRLFVRDIHYAPERMLGNKGKGLSVRSDGQEHFKRFLGCSRQNVCLYPPNKNTGSGWEVAVMSLEVQLTDAENAAFITFIVLLSRVIISYRLNLYLPISLMDENMARAQKPNAVREQLFYFRRDLFGGRDGKSNGSGRISKRKNAASSWHTVHHAHASAGSERGVFGPRGKGLRENAEYVELTIDEIINGSTTYCVSGIMNIILNYLPSMRLEFEDEQVLRRQLLLVKRRASGKLCTLAAWMRNFVQNHPEYHHNSEVSQSINYDMLRTMNDIEEGKTAAPELLG
ncbi:GCS-domain-containing protein [Coemansia reversa NRRL 1564]|uniref:Glutamate--cysteine ligase n=1 Tax=Coemansia reversa (strain ATCC 12441 / NRRL 1564) TaxID=763665 RepID=A0A2G5BJS6_COERN|nr:GCS-domain-containing protein [Coemansia reversa NRRL 1564]|eukprot:PIA19232.1 GCS-domain-containing protein [Coemansia reversa NRRL 1564]